MKLRHMIPFGRHVLVTLWRWRLGRWYYFRDRPDWFVNEIASAPDEQVADYPQLVPYIAEARFEQRRRADQALRTAAAIFRGIGQHEAADLTEKLRDANPL